MTGSVGPIAGLARLRALASTGGLDSTCDKHGIAVLTAFGSATTGNPEPNDLDIAVFFRPGYRPDYPTLISDLQSASDGNIDVVVLNGAGPVIRERALVGAVPLYEHEAGGWLRAATAAALERMDTAWMRRLDLDLLAG